MKKDAKPEVKPRVKPPENPYFCVVPWTHTFISPQSERRLCCASREPHTFIHQYLDQPGHSKQEYRPNTLEEHWNSPYVRDIRVKMLQGERLPECEVCNDKVLSLSPYRDWFTKTLFPHLINDCYEKTDEEGFTTMPPISFDYRITNQCNFKCRMCGEQLSSSWEAEKREHGFWEASVEPWMVPEQKKIIVKFQNDVVEKELEAAAKAGQVEELYWVGGEPLVWDVHWRVMKQLVEDKFAGKCFARYNTNLSIIDWRGVSLFKDLLPHFKNYLVLASIDGCGRNVEWIRTGINWDKWLRNFKSGIEHGSRGKDGMILDVTVTLPGMFSMKEMFDLALELDVHVATKIVYAFSPDIMMSPLALPRALLNDLCDDLIQYCEKRVTPKTESLLNTFREIRSRPTFKEQWPDEYVAGFHRGRDYQRKFAQFRRDGQDGRPTVEEFYGTKPEILKWWNGDGQQ